MDKKKYHARMVDDKLDLYLRTFSAVCVQGPKWCGKTWTSTMHSKSQFMLADPDGNFANRELAKMDIKRALEGKTPHLIDEWQEIPDIWDAVRYAADKGGERGKWILTGSATPPQKGVVHSGTGRIATLKMLPMSLWESGDSCGAVSLSDVCAGKSIEAVRTPKPELEEVINLVIRGGWPGSMGLTGDSAALVPQEYIENIINIDINKLDAIERDTEKVRKCLRSLARNESTAASTETIRKDIAEVDDASLSINTVVDYLNCFRRLFLLNDTPPFSTFLRSPVRIKQSAKRHFADPSLAAALLGASEKMLLRDRRTFGFLFEAMAVRDLEVYADTLGAKFYHYQDYHGNEFDGVIQFKDGDWSAFEVKLGHDQIEEAATELVRTSRLFTHNPPKSLAVIVGTTGDAYRRPDGVYVIPITALKP